MTSYNCRLQIKLAFICSLVQTLVIPNGFRDLVEFAITAVIHCCTPFFYIISINKSNIQKRVWLLLYFPYFSISNPVRSFSWAANLWIPICLISKKSENKVGIRKTDMLQGNKTNCLIIFIKVIVELKSRYTLIIKLKAKNVNELAKMFSKKNWINSIPY